MGIDAFVIRQDLDPPLFLGSFLDSPDFHIDDLQCASRDLDLGVGGSKKELAARIAREAASDQDALRRLLQALIARNKRWMTFEIGPTGACPERRDARELLTERGDKVWYGPVTDPSDPTTLWYLRPVFVPHYELYEVHGTIDVHRFEIRWLVFARVARDVLSLHWRGFSQSDEDGAPKRAASQFPYWRHIPQLLKEVKQILGANTGPPNMFNLILHTMWERYRGNPTYAWVDKRIRAEANGIALQARAGAAVDIDVPGILKLARTLSVSVIDELARQGIIGPSLSVLDETFLRTLIRELGTLSYEFSLSTSGGEPLIRAHTYLGSKPQSCSADSFPHCMVYDSWGRDTDQMSVLLNNLGNKDGASGSLSDILFPTA